VNSDFRVGPWLVQPSLNTISQNGTSSRVEPKMMEVLVCLAAHTGEVVPKEKLLQAVWPDTFVSDDVLKRSVSELRRVFADDAHESRIIETIPKRGYRLVLAVGQGLTHVGTAQAIEADPPSARPAIEKWRIGLCAMGIVVPVCGLLLAFNVAGIRERLVGTNGPPPIRSLAVLPLQNLSGDPSQEYFSDGMTEELITELSRIRGMKVISRTSVMRYKNSDKSLPEIARQLGVDGIVEGSVLRSGDRVRITAQLIYARTDANVWAETYDRDSRDVFALQEAVASAIAGKVKATMIPTGATQSKTPHTVNLKAHEAYLRGSHEDDIGGTLANRQGMQQASEEHFERAVEYYKQAIREDPLYARAYLALAYEDWSPEWRKEEEANAKKALEIDESLSEAHLLLGAIRLVRDVNWQEAERELLRAIELNPNSAAAHAGYAYYLDAAGRLDDGMKESYRAQELDPANDHLAPALYSRRQFDRLIELERDQLARNAGNSYGSAVAHKTLMVAYARLGERAASIEEFRQALIAYGYDALAEELRRGYERGGYQDALRQWLKAVQKQKPDFPFLWVAAYVHCELGERDAALAWLPHMEPDWEPAAAQQEADVFPNLVTLRTEPMWDPLRSDPRFEELVRRMHFPQ
jgi:TolB-like protein/DNA-binding winged helix-turn-helix (wHTH) protein/tetratricopeptide (TPR) repeat protein